MTVSPLRPRHPYAIAAAAAMESALDGGAAGQDTGGVSKGSPVEGLRHRYGASDAGTLRT